MRLSFANWRKMELPWKASRPWAAYRAVCMDTGEPGGETAGPQRGPLRKTPDELSSTENAQCVHALMWRETDVATVSELVSQAERLFEGAEDILEAVQGGPVEWWDVVEAGVVRYQVWLYGVDSGVVFEAGTTKQVAHVAQFALWCEEDLRLWKALAVAHRELKAGCPESDLARMAFNAAVRCPHCDRLNEIWIDAFDDWVICSGCGQGFDAAKSGRGS
ncbi:MAG: hypothetical protein JXR96_08085 [Deltaproteobacteria bacterium]|nr:hypothetical protein [Deltaproteobacteria bacterium]